MFITHNGMLHATEGHHRVAAALQRGDPHMTGWHYDLDSHPVAQVKNVRTAQREDCYDCKWHSGDDDESMGYEGKRKIAERTLYHWAPKDARDSIDQHGLDHRFGPERSEPRGIFFHPDEATAHDWVPDIDRTHDLYEVAAHGLQLHPDPYDTGSAYTRQAVPPSSIRRMAVSSMLTVG